MPEAPHISRDLLIFVEQSAERVAPSNIVRVAGSRLGSGRRGAACAAHTALGPTSLVLFDVSTCTSRPTPGDGFREPGFSKERRLEPQITIGLLIDASGFPLMVRRTRGNRA